MKKKPIETIECDSCHKEVSIEHIHISQIPFEEDLSERHICDECQKDEDRIIERFETGEPYAQV